jgi:hypothetical protein
VDAELFGEVGLALACTNPAADPLDLFVRQFELRFFHSDEGFTLRAVGTTR